MIASSHDTSKVVPHRKNRLQPSDIREYSQPDMAAGSMCVLGPNNMGAAVAIDPLHLSHTVGAETERGLLAACAPMSTNCGPQAFTIAAVSRKCE